MTTIREVVLTNMSTKSIVLSLRRSVSFLAFASISVYIMFIFEGIRACLLALFWAMANFETSLRDPTLSDFGEIPI